MHNELLHHTAHDTATPGPAAVRGARKLAGEWIVTCLCGGDWS